MSGDFLIGSNDPILITGSNGFIGTKVVARLIEYGFRNLRCFVRPSSDLSSLNRVINSCGNRDLTVDIIKGNLLLEKDCVRAGRDASVILHLAAGRGEKSYPNSYLNSVVTTKRLLDAFLGSPNLKRFVNVSSFTVYSPVNIRRGRMFDESCAIETNPARRGEAYCYAKVKQDEIVMEYGRKHNIPHVIVRPGVVYGPGNKGLTGRVGIATFGLFLHLGGGNRIPLTYVDNCADAIVLAGIKKGVGGEVFNIVDEDLPTSRQFLSMYKKNVGRFRSLYVPHFLNYALCCLWEQYSDWSKGQLPPVFNRSMYYSYWKGQKYSNERAKRLLGWRPTVPFHVAAKEYFAYQKRVRKD